MPKFCRYIGIDYSGAATPDSGLRGLRVFEARRSGEPGEVLPAPGSRKFWSRRALAEWLGEEICSCGPLLIGIDHGFSFPMAYFEKHGLPRNWRAFLDDFQAHWPTDQENVEVRTIRDGQHGNGLVRAGETRWLRLTERWSPSAKSVFQFDVQGQVATSTHAGLPWLRHLCQTCGARAHVWPFDGWQCPAGSSLLAEIYPSLWMRRFPTANRDGDQQAAYATAAWLQRADLDDSLARFLNPPLTSQEQATAKIEGWILGVA